MAEGGGGRPRGLGRAAPDEEHGGGGGGHFRARGAGGDAGRVG